jgi:hypothetical protein
MNNMKSMMLLMTLIMAAALPAKESWKDQPQAWLTRRAIVITMENDYQKALKSAKLAAKGLGLELQERQLSWDSERNTLSLSKDDCLGRGLGPYPCYLARGIDDWTSYISLELAGAYENLPPGRYAVVAGVYRELSADETREQKLLFEKALALFPKAMMLEVKVYTGVMTQVLDSF